MTMNKLVLALLASSALTLAGPAPAQDPGAAQTPADDDSAVVVPPETAADNADLAAKAAFLEAQVESLQEQLNDLKTQMTRVTPSWRGAPQQADAESGWSFKPKGFMQFDAGYVGTPGPMRAGTVGGLNYNNLGWNTRARRLVIGAEGAMPGGFGYKFELNLAQAVIDFEDIVLTWQRPGKPIQLTVGNFYPLSSLESMTSSRLTSFLERASFTDAFVYNRRLGATIALLDPKNDRYTLTAGLFSQEINNNSFNRTGWQASARATFSPMVGSTRVHLGANFQHRVAQRDIQNVQYRSRPFTQLTDQRFVDTGLIAADGDDIAGVELAAIHGPLHFAAEAQQAWVRGYRPGQTFGLNDNAAGGLFYTGDPSFLSGYAEVGFYLTGETRGYKGGKWDRTKVLKPIDKGGLGAVQANARIDYLDLTDRVGAGTALAAPTFINGGRQIGYQLSLIWNPIDYVRFQAQYVHGAYTGGPRATTVAPGSTAPADNRKYNVDSLAVRAQIEF
jgi:phosphate-selective porin OprO/OprP